MKITEYVGATGVISSDYTPQRASTPRAGDLVQWPDGTHGMIESIHQYGPNTVHVCHDNGSAFLAEDYVSISGGPFFMLTLDDLEPTYAVANANFWNWGENLPGASQDVRFTIGRPVFRYVGGADTIYLHQA